MKMYKIPITGNEWQGDLSLPYQALVQFYYAYNNKDMDIMNQNWYQSEEIAMNNPLVGVKRGWEEIKQFYKNNFICKAKVYMEFHDYTIDETKEMFYTVGRERGYFQLGKTKNKLNIHTSRIFKKIDSTWKQVYHHSSMDNPELLKRYRKAVLVR